MFKMYKELRRIGKANANLKKEVLKEWGLNKRDLRKNPDLQYKVEEECFRRLFGE